MADTCVAVGKMKFLCGVWNCMTESDGIIDNFNSCWGLYMCVGRCTCDCMCLQAWTEILLKFSKRVAF